MEVMAFIRTVQTFHFFLKNKILHQIFLASGMILLVVTLANVFWNPNWLKEFHKVELQSTYLHQEYKFSAQRSTKFCMKLVPKNFALQIMLYYPLIFYSRIMALRQILGPWSLTFFFSFFYINEVVHGHP